MKLVSFDEIRRIAYRALTAGGVAPGIDAECGWACAWLQAAGYDGLKLLVEALDDTAYEDRQPSLEFSHGIVHCHGGSCIFNAPLVVEMAQCEGRGYLNDVRHGLYVLPFAVQANLALGCPIDPAFHIGGARESNPYAEKISTALADGINVHDDDWNAVYKLSRAILVPESDTSRAQGAGAGLLDND